MKFGKKETFVTGLALLAMFLGAGNLIFPPMLGLQAGDNFWPAILGFVVTGVGLPLLGVTAVAKAGGDLQVLGDRVHPLFSKIITITVILCIGPLLAIPRTAATTFEVGVAPFLNITSPEEVQIALAITTVIYFTIALFFILRPTKILDYVGKLLTPFLILFLAIIVSKGIITPIGNLLPSQLDAPFSTGFLEGYNTMDALASVIFGLVIVNAIKEKGLTDKKEITKVTIIAGFIAAIGLSSVYLGIGYIGANTGSAFVGDSHGQMLSFIAESLLGSTGKIIIALTMALACMTTAIGLVASCGSYFSRLSNNKISYNIVCILTVLVSGILANMGLAKILEVSVPLLVTVYPIIIVLVVISLFHNLFKGNKTVYVTSVLGTTFLSLTNLLCSISAKFGFELVGLTNILELLPLHKQGLGWAIPALGLALLGWFLKAQPSNAKD